MRASAAIDLDSFGSNGHSSEGNSGDVEEFHCVDFLFFGKLVLIKFLNFLAAFKGSVFAPSYHFAP